MSVYNGKEIKIIRKRYFPNEEIDISKDEIVYLDDKLLVTKWLPIKPRDDMGRGISFYFLKEGYKISKLYNKDDNLYEYYCDICRYEIKKEEEYKMVDLLVDVIVDLKGNYKVVDFDEMIEMFEDKNLPPKEYMQSVKNFSKLISKLNDGEFPYAILDKYD